MSNEDEEQVDVRAVEMTPIQRMRHSAAHVMAEAVTDIFPDARLGIGPPIENGFYYDFDLPRSLSPDDLEEIEKYMSRHIDAGEKFECRPITLEEAHELFKDQPYKLELIDRFGDGNLTVYQNGEFVDLCRGPHVDSTSNLGPFKLMSVAGAYWRGDEKNPMLQRIYGTMWPTQDELDEYLHNLELARERDHRKLGRELGLFMFSPDVGSGIPLFFPKGEIIRHVMEDYVRETQTKYGYQHVWTAHLVKKELYERSGHLEHYADVMFPPMVDETDVYMLKPMNCPSHMTLFNGEFHSYRDLPLRYAEFATLYRYEKSGELSGLTRVRSLTQDDAHVFCTEDQIREEFTRAIQLIREVLHTYGFTEYAVQFSVRDSSEAGKFVADDEKWAKAERALKESLDALEVDYYTAAGEAAFYGPKADFMARDVLGREWQLSTIQIDFIQPERLGCQYIGEDGEPHTPVVIHRAVTGATERFLGVMIEHFGGAFPTWLSPVQAIVLPVADRHLDYAGQVVDHLKSRGLRAEADSRSERLNAKIRDAQVQKIPYMLVVGNKEVEAGTASVRLRTGEDLGARPLSEIADLIAFDSETKQLKPGPPQPVD